ncbi:MAG TPA: surface lipoprotein assembly modifier, partial [Sphingomicrobium sp.]
MLGAAAMLVLSASQAAASEGVAGRAEQRVVPAMPSWEQSAVQLMNQGKLDEASSIIEDRLRSHPKDTQARFLDGMIAIARKDMRKAIRVFRSILIDEPKATRVRLELARAFYLAKDYGNALRQFQFALAGKPPPQVTANIVRQMSAIRKAKSLSYNFGLAVAPDSNLNTGSSAREVTLFGLPFDLSEEAQQRSGVGLAIEAGGEWAPPIGQAARLRLGGSVQRREYSGSKFDDMTVGVYAGPRFIAGKWDVSLLGTGYRRWYGTARYNHAAGVRLETTYQLSPRIGILAAASAQSVRFYGERARDARLIALNASSYYALTSSSAATVKAGVARSQA